MKKGDQVQLHETVRVLSGNMAGCLGIVEEISGDSVTVRIDGIVNGEPLSTVKVFSSKALGRPE